MATSRYRLRQTSVILLLTFTISSLVDGTNDHQDHSMNMTSTTTDEPMKGDGGHHDHTDMDDVTTTDQQMDHGGHGHDDHGGDHGHDGHVTPSSSAGSQHNGDHGGDHNMQDDAGGHTGHSSNGAHDMQMFFQLGHNLVILFESWNVTTVGGLIGSCIGLFFVAALYEGLKWVRERLMTTAIKEAKRRAAAKRMTRQKANGDVNLPMKEVCGVEVTGNCDDCPVVLRVPFFDHLIQTLLHMLQILVSYLLMLAFMTYNVWVGLAIVFGAGVGYFVFAARMPRKASVSKMSEHCH